MRYIANPHNADAMRTCQQGNRGWFEIVLGGVGLFSALVVPLWFLRSAGHLTLITVCLVWFVLLMLVTWYLIRIHDRFEAARKSGQIIEVNKYLLTAYSAAELYAALTRDGLDEQSIQWRHAQLLYRHNQF